MRVTICYPAFLKGLPARHREVKQCLLALSVDVDIPEIAAEQAPVAISYIDHAGRTVEFREHAGRLYRSLGIGPDELVLQMNTRRIFDTRGEVLGVVSLRAMRDYFKVGRDKNVRPRNVAMSGNQMIIDDCDKDKAFDMGEAFVVSEDDLNRARSYEDQARERMAGFLSIDGIMCYESAEPIYCATPHTARGPGKVTIVNRGYAYLPDDPLYVERYPIWSQADATFFSALSAKEAASHAGISPDDIPRVNVINASVVRSDFEALGIERLARNLVSVIGSEFRSFDLQALRKSILETLAGDLPDGQLHDALADLISEASAISRTDTTGTAAKVLKRFTPELMDAVVERWHGRPVELVPFNGPALK